MLSIDHPLATAALIKNGADVSFVQTGTGLTALHRCAYGSTNGSAESARLLVNAGADANLLAQRADGFDEAVAPTHIAASRGHSTFLHHVLSRFGSDDAVGLHDSRGGEIHDDRACDDAVSTDGPIPPRLPSSSGTSSGVTPLAAQSHALLGASGSGSTASASMSTPPPISASFNPSPRSNSRELEIESGSSGLLAGAATTPTAGKSGRKSRKGKGKGKASSSSAVRGHRRARRPDVNVRTHRRWTPLHFAAHAGHQECCVVLA